MPDGPLGLSRSSDEDLTGEMKRHFSSHARRGIIWTLHQRSDAHDLISLIHQSVCDLDCWSRWTDAFDGYAQNHL